MNSFENQLPLPWPLIPITTLLFFSAFPLRSWPAAVSFLFLPALCAPLLPASFFLGLSSFLPLRAAFSFPALPASSPLLFSLSQALSPSAFALPAFLFPGVSFFFPHLLFSSGYLFFSSPLPPAFSLPLLLAACLFLSSVPLPLFPLSSVLPASFER